MKNKIIIGLTLMISLISIESYLQFINYLPSDSGWISAIEKISPNYNVCNSTFMDIEVHPFFGHVYNKKITGINSEGFFNEEFVETSSKNEYRIAILGSSVANQVSRYIKERSVYFNILLQKKIKKKITFLNLTLNASKSYQTLMIFLRYLQYFDQAIIIDGSNDIMSGTIDPITPDRFIVLRDYPILIYLGSRLVKLLECGSVIFQDNWLIKKVKIFLWLSDLLRNRAFMIRYYLFLYIKGDKTAFVKNPEESSYIERVERIWWEAFSKISIVSKAFNKRVDYFVQPNQYFVGGKILVPGEVSPHFEGLPIEEMKKNAVHRFYTDIWGKQKDLLALNKNFYNLSYIFKDSSTRVYADTCCHLNEVGLETLTEKIMANILNNWP